MKTRVVVVDDHTLFLAGVRAELGDASTWSARPAAWPRPCR
jgi:hypothetical protein